MRVSWLTTALVIIASAFTLNVRAQQPSLDEVVGRLDAYLTDYEPKLSELIADENMSQVIRRGVRNAGLDGVDFGTDKARQLRSEVAFVGLPDDAGWLGFRHVKTVDNRPVKDSSASLTSALSTRGYAAARRLLMESAQHNLGLARTTNLPNLPLEFLHRRNRKRLLPRLDGTDSVRNTETVKVVFTERLRPTLIGNPNGNDMPCVIRAWIDPKSGALWRAEVQMFESAETREQIGSVRVEFDRDPKLDLLVPSEMNEFFAMPPPASGISTASYRNFRRFQTSARIVPPPPLP